jgi:hypothetical protein
MIGQKKTVKPNRIYHLPYIARPTVFVSWFSLPETTGEEHLTSVDANVAPKKEAKKTILELGCFTEIIVLMTTTGKRGVRWLSGTIFV